VDADRADSYAFDGRQLSRNEPHRNARSGLPHGTADAWDSAAGGRGRLRGAREHRHAGALKRDSQAIHASGLPRGKQHEQRRRGDLLSRPEREHAAGHAHANPYNSRDGNGHADRYAHGNSDGDRYGYADGNGDTYSDADGYGNSDSDCDGHATGCRDTYAYTDRDRHGSRDADCYGNSDSDRNRNAHSNNPRNGHADAHRDGDSGGDSHAHADRYGNSDVHANAYAHRDAFSHADRYRNTDCNSRQRRN